MLPKHTDINDHFINLVENFLSHPPVLQYFLFVRKMVAFDFAFEVDYQDLVSIALV